MPEAPPAAVVVGAQGMIGRALLASLAATGSVAVGTTRTTLDLNDTPDTWPPLPAAPVVFLCAAVGSLGRCADDPVMTRRINTTHTIELTRRCVDAGAFVVFLSTSQVFDGALPLSDELAAPSPQSEYGRQKADAEAGLLAFGDTVAIVRLTKVIATDTPLFAGWAADLRAGQPVQAFDDMVMAPVSIGLAVDALCRVARLARPGITHVSARSDISYATAARHICLRLGADATLVVATSTAAVDLPAGAAPAHTSLGTESLQALGLAAPAPLDALEAVTT